MARFDADSRWMHLAYDVAEEFSTCASRKVGAVVVLDGKEIGIGWNGVPPKERHCTEVGCARAGCASGENLHWCRGAHAKGGAIAAAAGHRGGFKGATMYTILWPCRFCWSMIGVAGITRLVYVERYAGPEGAPPSIPPASVKVEKWYEPGQDAAEAPRTTCVERVERRPEYEHAGKLGPWARRGAKGTRYLDVGPVGKPSYKRIVETKKDGTTWRYLRVLLDGEIELLAVYCSQNTYRKRET